MRKVQSRRFLFGDLFLPSMSSSWSRTAAFLTLCCVCLPAELQELFSLPREVTSVGLAKWKHLGGQRWAGKEKEGMEKVVAASPYFPFWSRFLQAQKMGRAVLCCTCTVAASCGALVGAAGHRPKEKIMQKKCVPSVLAGTAAVAPMVFLPQCFIPGVVARFGQP